MTLRARRDDPYAGLSDHDRARLRAAEEAAARDTDPQARVARMGRPSEVRAHKGPAQDRGKRKRGRR